MEVIKLRLEEMYQQDARNYNPSIWDDNIKRMLNYSDVVFYHVPKGNGYDYDRYYVEYTLPEGIRLLNTFEPFNT